MKMRFHTVVRKSGRAKERQFFLKTIYSVSRLLLLCSFGLLLFYCPASAASGDVDRIVVVKNKRVMMIFKDGEIYKGYRIALGRQSSGHKIMAGDKRTPEGSYIIESKNPASRFHLSLKVSYPNAYDLETAHKLGVPPGGDIMIHGLSPKLASLGKMHRYQDWTDGCIAVTNTEIEEIWRLVPEGIPIEIKP
jgi:murein L,D-transpeptidase YafK